MIKLSRLFFALFIFLFVLCGCVRLPEESDLYKIAVVAPQSGTYALLGQSIIRGAELAVNEANNNGGINNKK